MLGKFRSSKFILEATKSGSWFSYRPLHIGIVADIKTHFRSFLPRHPLQAQNYHPDKCDLANLDSRRHRPSCSARISPEAIVVDAPSVCDSTTARSLWNNSRATRFQGLHRRHSSSKAESKLAEKTAFSMANITRENFEEVVDQVEQDIAAADFIAIDMEMTGIQSTRWRRAKEMDTLEVRYLNVRNSAENFALLQCGVCTFKWNAERQVINARPYNFYLFPAEVLERRGPQKTFLCQASSMGFLASHNFDFNTCIYKGISFLSEEQEAEARRELGLLPDSGPGRSLKSRMPKSEIPLKTVADVAFTEAKRREVFQWRDTLIRDAQLAKSAPEGTARSASAGGKPDVPGSPSGGSPGRRQKGGEEEMVLLLGRPAMRFPTLSRHESALFRQLLHKHFSDVLWVPDTVAEMVVGPLTSGRSGVWAVFVGTVPGGKAAFEAEVLALEQEAKESQLRTAIGFRRVIDAIALSGKPLIGHNCSIDLAQIHSKFLGPLPPSVYTFASSLAAKLHCIIDTKYLLRAHQRIKDDIGKNGTSLAAAFKRSMRSMSGGLVVEVDPDFKRYQRVGVEEESSDQFSHEAGFDAYMTGVVFARACHLLNLSGSDLASIAGLVRETSALRRERGGGRGGGEHQKRKREQAAESCPSGSIGELGNLLWWGIPGDFMLDLATCRQATPPASMGRAGPPSFWRFYKGRENVALAWGFSRELTEEDLRRAVAQICWSNRVKVNPVFIDDTSALLDFQKPKFAARFINLVSRATARLEGGAVQQQQQAAEKGEDLTMRDSAEASTSGTDAGKGGVEGKGMRKNRGELEEDDGKDEEEEDGDGDEAEVLEARRGDRAGALDAESRSLKFVDAAVAEGLRAGSFALFVETCRSVSIRERFVDAVESVMVRGKVAMGSQMQDGATVRGRSAPTQDLSDEEERELNPPPHPSLASGRGGHEATSSRSGDTLVGDTRVVARGQCQPQERAEAANGELRANATVSLGCSAIGDESEHVAPKLVVGGLKDSV